MAVVEFPFAFAFTFTFHVLCSAFINWRGCENRCLLKGAPHLKAHCECSLSPRSGDMKSTSVHSKNNKQLE